MARYLSTFRGPTSAAAVEGSRRAIVAAAATGRLLTTMNISGCGCDGSSSRWMSSSLKQPNKATAAAPSVPFAQIKQQPHQRNNAANDTLNDTNDGAAQPAQAQVQQATPGEDPKRGTPSRSIGSDGSTSARESFWATLSLILGGSTAYLAYKWRQSQDRVNTNDAALSITEDKVKLPPPRASGVVHESEVPWVSISDFSLPNTPADMFSLSNTKDGAGAEFQFRKRPLSSVAGGDKIGTSLYEVPPGKTAFPFHYHTANEEAMYILDGIGVIRIGDNNIPVHRGSYIAMPVGRRHAHQLWNTSESEILRYLCYSTNNFPEITVYPDSGKVGAQDGPSKLFSWFYSRDAVPFFAGEGGAFVSSMTPSPAHANGPSAESHAADKAKSIATSTNLSSTPQTTNKP